MEALFHLLGFTDLEDSPFPPTLLFNEGWLLRIILDWFSRNPVDDFVLGFSPEATWFSEALLPTPFKALFKGDPHAEARTHADGVIGHIFVGEQGKVDLSLAPKASQFVALEAKIGSPLAAGIKAAPTYDQAARTVACMAEVLRLANRPPPTMSSLGYYVLAPKEKIDAGLFEEALDPPAIRRKVEARAAEQSDGKRDWLSDWFAPLMDSIRISALAWEAVIQRVADQDKRSAKAIAHFYESCLEFS